MPAPSQTVFDGFQSCRHPIPAGLSYQHEPAVAIFPADVREPEEVEPRQPGGCKLKTAPVRPVVAARPAEYVCSEDLFY